LCGADHNPIFGIVGVIVQLVGHRTDADQELGLVDGLSGEVRHAFVRHFVDWVLVELLARVDEDFRKRLVEEDFWGCA
jgi:hypothetical protein